MKNMTAFKPSKKLIMRLCLGLILLLVLLLCFYPEAYAGILYPAIDFFVIRKKAYGIDETSIFPPGITWEFRKEITSSFTDWCTVSIRA